MKHTLAIIMALLPLAAAAQKQLPTEEGVKAHPFSLSEVQLKPGIYTRRTTLNDRYLLNFPTEKLLHPFRNGAQLLASPSYHLHADDSKDDLYGLYTAHFIAAASKSYAQTVNKTLKQKTDTIIDTLRNVQQQWGNGYLAAFPPTWFEASPDNKHTSKAYYATQKLMDGLMAAYQYTGNQTALDVAHDMSIWLYRHCKRLSAGQRHQIQHEDQGGMSRTLRLLASYTNDKRPEQLAAMFDDNTLASGLLSNKDVFKHQHANTFVTRLMALADKSDRVNSVRTAAERQILHKAVTDAWQQLVRHRSYATGGISSADTIITAPTLQPTTARGMDQQDACSTYNMLQLTGKICEWHPTVEVADYYENTLMNGILGTMMANKPGTQQQYVAQQPGAFRVFQNPDTAANCCSGIGLEAFATMNANIYFHNASTLWINQYIPSTLNWSEKELVVEQETGYPRFDDVHFTIKTPHPQRLTVKLRVPGWLQEPAQVCINGSDTLMEGMPGKYISINREWHDGDTIRLDIPRNFHLWHMPDNPRCVAIYYGPVLMAANLGTDGIPAAAQKGYGQAAEQLQENEKPIEVPVIVSDSDNWLNRYHLHQGHRLTFDAPGLGRPKDIVLTPFYDMPATRYAIYFDVMTTTDYQSRQRSTGASGN